jgi:hypothetical protein
MDAELFQLVCIMSMSKQQDLKHGFLVDERLEIAGADVD